MLDFNDLLIRARELLVGPQYGELRKRLAAQIRLLLVDEFQDTDPLQVELIQALCDNDHLRGKLFFVGDHKQSIYRFRGAQPHVFHRAVSSSFPSKGGCRYRRTFAVSRRCWSLSTRCSARSWGQSTSRFARTARRLAPCRRWSFCGPANASESPLRQTGQADETTHDRRRLYARATSGSAAARPTGSPGESGPCSTSGEKIVWDEKAAAAAPACGRCGRATWPCCSAP